MANTLTGLLQTIYDAQRKVSREMTGMIPAVSKDAKAEMVTLNQPIRSPVVPALAMSDISPGNISETGADREVSFIDLEITKQKKVSFHITGEEAKGLEAGGTMGDIDQQTYEQAFRTLGNAIESDLCGLYKTASRAIGAVGMKQPFDDKDNLVDLANARKILDDNGAPPTGRSIILNTTAAANLRGKQPSVFKVNEDGSPAGRRQGAFGSLFNLDVGESVQFTKHVIGDATMAINNGSGYAKGARVLTIDTGGATENYNAGDIITIGGDASSSAYVVSEDSGDNPTSLTIAEPGLRSSVADDAGITVSGAYVPSLAFSQDAFHLACRVPAIPPGGDMADDREYIMDTVSGLVYEVALYRQYRQLTVEIGICWGIKTINPAHAAIIPGP